MKLIIIILSLLIFSFTSKENKKKIIDQTNLNTQVKISNKKKIFDPNLTFEETQDSLRNLLLKSKSNENLKSSILQELYIRGLVNQVNDHISFKLPFNLHGLDCGAPDCYSTDISFEIATNEPIEFPQNININLLEHGCVDQEKKENHLFQLDEISSEYVNYYSKKLSSNLIIKKNGQLFYFPHEKANSIKVESLDRMYDNNEFEEAEIVPFQSIVMTTFEYESFIKEE